MAFTINPREMWAALAAKYAFKLKTRPVRKVFIHHGATFAPFELQDEDGDGIPDVEERIWKGYQRFHMVTRKWSDIAYNFGVGQSGSVLEGRGWLRIGGATGHPEDQNSLSICAIGNFQTQRPTEALINAIVLWIITGIELGHIHPDAEILGHKDKPYGTSCPGRYLYAELPNIRSMVADGRVSTEDTMDMTLDEVRQHLNAAPDGTKGEAVRMWQIMLFQHGTLPYEDIDGIKGPGTRAAHKAYEEGQGYPNANELIGQKSWATLLAGPKREIVHVEVEVPVEVPVVSEAMRNLITANDQLAERLQDEVDGLDG